MIKLVLSDVDGTLVPLGQGVASSRTLRAIHQLQEAGVRFGLSTGRDIVELREIFQDDDAAFRTGVLSNGKKIMVDGKLTHLSLLSNDGLRRAARAVAQFPHTFMTAYPYETAADNPIYCVGVSETALEEWAKVYAFRGIVVSEVPDIQVIGATIATNAPAELLDDLRDAVLQACPEFDIVKPSERWWDILPKGLNKGTALQMLMRDLQVSEEEVVVFGDADNDLAILCSVENSVAVENATPAVKAAARFHIGSCDSEAVAQALEDIARAVQDGSVPSFMGE